MTLSLGENIDSGRVRTAGEPRDNGRCCHERVPARDRVTGGSDFALEAPKVSDNGCGESREELGVPLAASSFRGPRKFAKGLSTLASRMVADCCRMVGDLLKSSCLDRFIGERIEVGVPALEADLVGESDLARSATLLVQGS